MKLTMALITANYVLPWGCLDNKWESYRWTIWFRSSFHRRCFLVWTDWEGQVYCLLRFVSKILAIMWGGSTMVKCYGPLAGLATPMARWRTKTSRESIYDRLFQFWPVTKHLLRMWDINLIGTKACLLLIISQCIVLCA